MINFDQIFKMESLKNYMFTGSQAHSSQNSNPGMELGVLEISAHFLLGMCGACLELVAKRLEEANMDS